MLRAIKIRLYPNKEQEFKLNKVLGCCRFVYNQMLALKQQEYNENKKSLGLTDLSKYFHGKLLKDKKVSIPIIDLIYDIAVEGEDPEKLLTFLVEKN